MGKETTGLSAEDVMLGHGKGAQAPQQADEGGPGTATG
jgi:hypothetical protein